MTQTAARLATGAAAMALVGGAVLLAGKEPERPIVADAHATLTEARAQVVEAERLHGAQSLEVAQALRELGRASEGSPQDRAEGFAALRRALAIRESRLDPLHPDVADALEGLAILLWEEGSFEEEQRLVKRALVIRQAQTPRNDGWVARDLHLLSDIYRVQGDYGRALQLREEAAPLFERAHGAMSDSVAVDRYTLALIQSAIGDRAAAIENAAKSVEIRESILAPTDPRLGRSLNLLGSLLVDDGQLERAERALEQARTIWEADEVDPLLTASALRNLARLHEKQGDLARAVQTYRRVLAIRSAALQPGDPLVGQTLAELGTLERKSGDGKAARESLRRALEIQEGSNLRSYPEWARTLREQSQLDGSEGLYDAALAAALEAERISREHFQTSALGLSEREALARARRRNGGLDLAWAWASNLARRGALGPDAASRLVDESIQSRALVLDTLVTRQRILALHADEETAARVEALRRARGRLIHLLQEEATERLPEAQANADRAERALAEKSREYRLELERSRPGLLAVRRALPQGSALVSYFHYEAESAGYAACVLLPGKEPRIIPLGAAKEIDAAVREWSERVSKDPRPGDLAQNEAGYSRAARELASRIWDPLAPLVEDVDRVLIVPDGMLHGVSLASLQTKDGAYLAETGPALHYLSAERDLVGGDESVRPQRGLLVVGDAAYGGRFDPLPGTRREALDVASRWVPGEPVKRLLREEAEESALKQLAPSYGVLHLATHAFIGTGGDPYENPLRVAGLAFAKGSTGEEDGILTAEEIALLDLQGVQWAVLSACASGRGTLEPGEGVLGLRRAFQIAGARTLVVSLWPIEDDATRYWMRALYDARRDKARTVDAVHSAMRDVLEAQRRAGSTTHPYFWGSFVSIGDWR